MILDADSFEKIIGDCKNSADQSTPDAVNSTDLSRPVNDTIIIDDDDDLNASAVEVTNTDLSREIMKIMTDLSPVVNETDHSTMTDFDTPAGGETDLSTAVVENVVNESFALPMNLGNISVSVEEEKDLQPFDLQQMFLTELPINTTYNEDDNKNITTTASTTEHIEDAVAHTTTTDLDIFDFKEEETNCVNLEQHSDLFETMDLDDDQSMSDLFFDDFDSILETYNNPVMTDQPMHPTSSTPSSSSSNSSSSSSVDAEWGDLLSDLFPSLV